jgi:cAMP-specific phosphodiesterase 4
MFQKYESYLKLCSEKVAYYKYFLRTADHLLMDFNKQGELIFLSRPITSAMVKQHVSLNIPDTINRSVRYTEIFIRNHLLSDIEMSLS